jgi:hypothetical protein
MPTDHKPQLANLAGLCRRLAVARERVAELEAQRDQLIASLREKGVPGAALAERSGLSAGRVTQIAQTTDGHATASKPRKTSNGGRRRAN